MSRWSAFVDIRYGLRHPLARKGMFAFFVSLAILLGTIAFWWPARHTHETLVDDLASKRRELVLAQQADDLMRSYSHAQKQIPILEKKLEQAVSQAQLVESFSRLARRHGVKILSEAYDNGKDKSNAHAALMVDLTLQGRYVALRDFLNELSLLPTWNELQEVRFEATRDAAIVKGRIRIVTYRKLSSGAKSP